MCLIVDIGSSYFYQSIFVQLLLCYHFKSYSFVSDPLRICPGPCFVFNSIKRGKRNQRYYETQKYFPVVVPRCPPSVSAHTLQNCRLQSVFSWRFEKVSWLGCSELLMLASMASYSFSGSCENTEFFW